MASRVETCNFMASPPRCGPARSTACLATSSIDVFLELDIGPCGHAFAAEEEHGQVTIPCDHGSHLADARLLELAGNCFEQRAADPVQTHPWLNGQRKHPAAGG